MDVRWRRCVAGLASALAVAIGGGAIGGDAPAQTSTDYRDGHARPRALAFNAVDGLLYVALSTADALAVVDPAGAAPRVVARVPVCRFPGAVVALPDGGALVACRFEAGLRRVARAGRRWQVAMLAPEVAAGARGLALSPDGRLAYVASPATGGVEVVSISGGGAIQQRLATGLSPRALRVVPAGALPGERRALLLVSSFIDHRVTVHPLDDEGLLAPPVQTIATEAPVLDMLLADAGGRPALWLLTHEDRPLSRAHLSVEGLDSGVLSLRARTDGGVGPPFVDEGPGRRDFVNLSERAPDAVVELAAIARDERSGVVAIAGAGTDNVVFAARGQLPSAREAATVTVGAAPAALAVVSGDRARWVTADRLTDTLTFVDSTPGGPRVTATLVVGAATRTSLADLGELMFYSRRLTPRNVADGPLSLYTCAACHDDGHVDGRRHPSKRNRFYSMTKTCRGLATTAPYLSLGDPATIGAFADNIVATHAQGAEGGPDDYDRYPVTLRVPGEGVGSPAPGDDARWRSVVLTPDEVRAALAAYMSRIPPEPSPFVPAGARTLPALARRGLATFRESCARCHQLVGDSAVGDPVPARELERRLLGGQVALTSPRLHDVGTPVLGKTGNNPPSLRGAWDAAPYFSDGSARTLEEVLTRTNPDADKVHAPENAQGRPAFDAKEREALLAFLRAL